MLDSCYKSCLFSCKAGNDLIYNREIAINRPDLIDDPFCSIYRRMTDMDKYIGLVPGIKVKIACAITGIATYNHIIAKMVQRICKPWKETF